MGDMEAVN